MPTTHAAMAAVDSQPSARSQPPIVKSPMMLRFAVISISSTMSGTATTPLIPALQ